MIPSADPNLSRRGLLLEVTLQAQVRAPLRQHLVVHSPVRIVARRATFAHRFMLEHERPPLLDVALRACVLVRCHREWSARCCLPFVRIMAIAATHLPVAHRMVVRQIKAPFHFQMAGEANLRILVRVDDCVPRSTRLRVQAPRPMAAFATDILRI